MPDFVLNRNHTLRTVHGHIINFKKGEPTHVPQVAARDALMIGAEPVDGDKEFLDPEKEAPAPLSPDERQAALITAFKLIEERNGRGDFDARGLPKADALTKIVEFATEKREFEPLWVAYQAEKLAAE